MRKLRRMAGRKSASLVFLSVLLVFILSFAGSSPGRDFQLTRNMDIFFSLIREINLFYVDETDPEELIENSINGLLEGLDPYTTYVPESERENYETMTTGRYGGIGALIRQAGEYVMIIEPYENFPAQRSGLRAGDIITSIDGESTRGLLVSQVSELLKGSPNSKISITVTRNNLSSPITYDLAREEVKINNVTWYGIAGENVGYIQFNGFTENAHKEVRDAVTDLKKNFGAQSIILDVRGNPGGLLMEAVNVTNLFVPRGEEIVSTRGKVRQWDQTYRARNNPLDPDIPLVVITGRSSASAAEIVAGAVQDLDRGLVIGERTFGKGLIQTTRQLSYNAQLKITTAKYYTPSGRCIQSMVFSNGGAPSVIPDSLINEFKTKNGRTVYDGGGIMPDIEINEDRPAPVVVNLYTGNHIFNFATKFASENQTIPPVNDFRISDEIYDDFISFLDKENFDYQTRTEVHLKQLINAAKEEGYYDISSDVLSELNDRIKLDKMNDLTSYKDQIKDLLREEIVSRYYFQKGRVEVSITNDPVVMKAVQILNNSTLYRSVLEGTVNHRETAHISGVNSYSVLFQGLYYNISC